MIDLVCHGCGKTFQRKASEHRNNLKRGRKFFACSPPCRNRSNIVDKQKTCGFCQNAFEYKTPEQIYCSRDCSSKGHTKPKVKKLRGADYSQITLGSLREKYSTGVFHAKLRGHARSVYKKSGQSMQCANCGYNLHVDICHIVDVGAFGSEALVSEVNSLHNLVALDKRCHWEFDHGHLEL